MIEQEAIDLGDEITMRTGGQYSLNKAVMKEYFTRIAEAAARRAFHLIGEDGEITCWCAAHEKEFVAAVLGSKENGK